MKKLFLKLRRSAAADAALISLALFFLILSAGLYFMMDGRHVRFSLSGGAEMDVEYGQSFTDPGASAAAVGAFSASTPLDVACQGSVDTSRLGSYSIVYKARYKARLYTAERIVNVVDTTPPEITLMPDQGVSDWLSGYVESGYSAYDKHDGDLTANVEVTHLGSSVVYTVADAAGNRASAERRLSGAAAKPVLKLNGDENVTISARPCYADPGCTAADGDGRDLSAYITVGGTLRSDVPGEYTVTYSITNADGDSVSAERRVTVAGQALPDTVTPEKTIFLTFDDGPGPYTGALLDTLAKYGAKATFFVTGNREAYRGEIQRAFSEGHAIGVHSYTHDYGLIYSGEDAFFDDFNAAEDMIYSLTGSYTQLCRFPGGSSNTVSRFTPGIMSRLTERLGGMGYKYFDWNVYSGDAGETTSTDTVAQNIINGCTGKSCAVVLQHDVKGFSVAAVERVLQWGAENGYSFKALDLSSPDAHHGVAN